MEDEKLRKRRLRSKINQRRYRQRKKTQHLADQQFCEKLSQKIYQLEGNTKLLKEQYYLTTHKPEFHTHKIQKYLACFQFGLEMESKSTQQQQLHCLRTTMDQQLILGTIRLSNGNQVGVLALEKQWFGCAALFPNFELTVQSLSIVGEGDVVHANCNTKLQYTEDAVRALHPTFLSTPELLNSIIDREFNFQTRLMFYFDDNGKVQDLGVDVSLFTAVVSQLILSGEADATCLRSHSLLPREVVEDENTSKLLRCRS